MNTVDTMSYIIMQKVAPLQIYYAKRNEMQTLLVTPQSEMDPSNSQSGLDIKIDDATNSPRV